MPVLKKETHKALMIELRSRFQNLVDRLDTRDINNKYEGCGKGSKWTAPERMCATKGSDMDLRMAVDDFKTVLAEIKRLK